MYYTTREVASKFHVTVQTVCHWIGAGKLSASKVGKSYLITDEDLKELMERQKVRIKKTADSTATNTTTTTT